MFCSTIIPTVNRASLSRAVKSVLQQEFPKDEYEVIVVNDSGQPLDEADWQQSPQVQVITTNRRERSVARNVGAAVAKGKYLHFLDDDDWLLPCAFREFHELSKGAKNAAWLYGGTRVITADGTILGEINVGVGGNCFAQLMGGASIPIQASLVRSDSFFGSGGYNSKLLATQDIDLARRIALHEDFAFTTEVVACLFRGITWGSKTDYDRATYFNRLGRDQALSEPGAFTRLIDGANSAALRGRVLKLYISGVLWNIRNKKLFTASSRLVFGLVSLVLSTTSIYSREFWRALTTEHDPNTVHTIMANAIKKGIV